MATKKLQGDLNVTGNYSQGGTALLTTAPSAYDENTVYHAGDVVIHEGKIYRCIDETSGAFGPNFWVEETGTSALTLAKSYSPVFGASAGFAIADGTVSYDDGTTTITINYTGAPLTASSNFLTFIRTETARAILWPNTEPNLGVYANVAFHDFVLDMTQFDPSVPSGTVTLSCFSPLCTLVWVINIGLESSHSITIAFNAVGASMYALLKTLIQGGQYPAVNLVPVVSNLR